MAGSESHTGRGHGGPAAVRPSCTRQAARVGLQRDGASCMTTLAGIWGPDW